MACRRSSERVPLSLVSDMIVSETTQRQRSKPVSQIYESF